MLGRLLALNHERYEEEVRMGLQGKKGKGKQGGRGARGQRPISEEQTSLPGMEDVSPRQLGLFGEEES